MGAAVVYFYLAAILSLVAVADSVDKAVVPGDRVGLDAIFDATDGQHWRNNTGWLSDSCWCTWYGVTCYNGTLGACASVYAIDLSSNGLRGCIPDKIGAIQLMVSLNMTNNTLSSTLPAALFKLPRLQYLNIGLGQLTGTIPTAVSQCTTLRELSLYTHQLSGTVPSLSELGELRILDLYGNKLSGPLPSVSSAVEYVMVNNNTFSGDIPPSVAGRQPKSSGRSGVTGWRSRSTSPTANPEPKSVGGRKFDESL